MFGGWNLGAKRHSKTAASGGGVAPPLLAYRYNSDMQRHPMTAIDSPAALQPPERNAPGVVRMGSARQVLVHLSSWMWQYASRATTDHKTTTLSRMHEDAISVILISVIACLVLAILILGSPEAAQLTPGQINLLPSWGP